MSANTQITSNEISEQAAMAENETQAMDSRKKRNTMKNVAQKISQLRELAKAGCSREQICAEMEIDLKGFENLRRKLNDLDKTYYDIPHEEADRSGKVGKAGILVSADRLLAMGAQAVFAQGTTISIRLDGERIIIERAGGKISPSANEAQAMNAFVADVVRNISLNAESEAEVA